MSSSTLEAATAAPRTRGRVQAVFAPDPGGKSYLARQYASYPFHVCRAQYLDPDLPEMASIYLQTSAGGLYAGDRLSVEITTEAGAKAHVTTQASSLAYRMPDGEARQQVLLSGGPGSLLEYLPDPTILFPEARLRTKVTLRPAPGALIIAGGSFLPHDPDGTGRPFGLCAGETRVIGADSPSGCPARSAGEGPRSLRRGLLPTQRVRRLGAPAGYGRSRADRDHDPSLGRPARARYRPCTPTTPQVALAAHAARPVQRQVQRVQDDSHVFRSIRMSSTLTSAWGPSSCLDT